MIDPKLDKIPVKNVGDFAEDVSLADDQRTQRGTAQRGLSINETIAGDANLSVGSRGVDTSGVRSGTGAGAGQTHLSPGARGESPAPNVVPGPRGSGTTPLGPAGSEQNPSFHEGAGSSPTVDELSQDEIAQHAYRCWHERGCPEGSSHEDWNRAERELRARKNANRTSSATA